MGRCTLYSDGDTRRIAWAIRTGTQTLRQWRNQAEMYRGVVSDMQARFMALHVGLFWGIGVFAIRNGDDIGVMVDDQAMLAHLELGESGGDEFIDRRIHFVNMLADQRGLGITFESVSRADNIASPLLL